MPRIVVLPLDDRPVNYDYPRYLAAMAGLTLDLPPRAALGNPWRASQHAELVRWLEGAASGAAAVILAVDTLAYGGLIPARTSSATVAEALGNLEVLHRLKIAHPGLRILGYSTILRISRADSAEEEKHYWATYGSGMFRLSYLEHKSSLGEASPAESNERAALRSQIPDPIYADYLQGRQRNHAVNRAMLDWLAEWIFDYLLFPQDDTADYGWNIAEARTLQGLIRARGLNKRAITYPGADAIGCLLLARFVCQQAGFAPRVWPRYSSIQSAQVITDYEDRPIHELLKAHLAPLDGVIVEAAGAADILLFVNAPAEKQGTAELQWLIEQELLKQNLLKASPAFEMNASFRETRREMFTPRRSVEEFVRAIQLALHASKPAAKLVALADVAFVNGADLALGRLLVREGLAPHLAAYGGWNTAGNTLGTVLAHSVVYALMQRDGFTPEQQAAHLAFLFLRYGDDYYYQAIVRTQVSYEDRPAAGLEPGSERLPDELAGQIEGCVRQRLLEAVAPLHDLFVQAGLARQVRVDRIYLPWQRLFEVGFDVEVELP